MAQTKSGIGLPSNTAAALTYLLGWVTGIVFLLIEKDDKFVRFHAMQSVVAFGLLTVLSLVPVVGWVLSPFLMVVGFILWLVLIFKAYQGQEFMLPVIGPWAKKQVAKL